MNEILKLLKPYNSVSIIGMNKNVGKTTTLNHILEEARGNMSLGLTSIGRDGEELDRVTSFFHNLHAPCILFFYIFPRLRTIILKVL